MSKATIETITGPASNTPPEATQPTADEPTTHSGIKVIYGNGISEFVPIHQAQTLLNTNLNDRFVIQEFSEQMINDVKAAIMKSQEEAATKSQEEAATKSLYKQHLRTLEAGSSVEDHLKPFLENGQNALSPLEQYTGMDAPEANIIAQVYQLLGAAISHYQILKKEASNWTRDYLPQQCLTATTQIDVIYATIASGKGIDSKNGFYTNWLNNALNIIHKIDWKTHYEMGLLYYDAEYQKSTVQALERSHNLQKNGSVKLTEEQMAEHHCALYEAYMKDGQDGKAAGIMETLKQINKPVALTQLNVTRAGHKRKIKDWDAARSYLQKALDESAKLSPPHLQSVCHAMMAHVYLDEYELEVKKANKLSPFRKQDRLLDPALEHFQTSLGCIEQTIELLNASGQSTDAGTLAITTQNILSEGSSGTLEDFIQTIEPSSKIDKKFEKIDRPLDLLIDGLETLADLYSNRADVLPQLEEQLQYIEKSIQGHDLLERTLKICHSIGKDIFIDETGKKTPVSQGEERSVAYQAVIAKKEELEGKIRAAEAKKIQDAELHAQAEIAAQNAYKNFVQELDEEQQKAFEKEEAAAAEALKKALEKEEAAEKARLEAIQKHNKPSTTPTPAEKRKTKNTPSIPPRQKHFQEGCDGLGKKPFNVDATLQSFKLCFYDAQKNKSDLFMAQAQWGMAETYSKEAYRLRGDDLPAAVKQFETCATHISEGLHYISPLLKGYTGKAAPKNYEDLRNALEFMANNTKNVINAIKNELKAREKKLEAQFNNMRENRDRAIYMRGLLALGWDYNSYFHPSNESHKGRPSLKTVWEIGMELWTSNSNAKHNHAKDRNKCEAELEELRGHKAQIEHMEKKFEYLSEAAVKDTFYKGKYNREAINNIAAPKTTPGIKLEDRQSSFKTLEKDCNTFRAKNTATSTTSKDKEPAAQTQQVKEPAVTPVATQPKEPTWSQRVSGRQPAQAATEETPTKVCNRRNRKPKKPQKTQTIATKAQEGKPQPEALLSPEKVVEAPQPASTSTSVALVEQQAVSHENNNTPVYEPCNPQRRHSWSEGHTKPARQVLQRTKSTSSLQEPATMETLIKDYEEKSTELSVAATTTEAEQPEGWTQRFPSRKSWHGDTPEAVKVLQRRHSLPDKGTKEAAACIS